MELLGGLVTEEFQVDSLNKLVRWASSIDELFKRAG